MNAPVDRALSHVAGTLETPRRGGLLWLVVLATAALDATTTTIGIAVGLPEGNPVVATALAAVGVPGLVALQVGFVAAVTGLMLPAGSVLAVGLLAGAGVVVCVLVGYLWVFGAVEIRGVVRPQA